MITDSLEFQSLQVGILNDKFASNIYIEDGRNKENSLLINLSDLKFVTAQVVISLPHPTIRYFV